MKTFEEWRQQLNLHTFNLVAHSIGGYLMGTYASMFPHRIIKLMLLSPAGLKHKPINMDYVKLQIHKDIELTTLQRHLQYATWGKVSIYELSRVLSKDALLKIFAGQSSMQKIPASERPFVFELIY